MSNFQVYDFGLKDGVQTYRIIGEKKDLELIVQECHDADATFNTTPEIEETRRGQWTILLKIELPLAEVRRIGMKRVGWNT